LQRYTTLGSFKDDREMVSRQRKLRKETYHTRNRLSSALAGVTDRPVCASIPDGSEPSSLGRSSLLAAKHARNVPPRFDVPYLSHLVCEIRCVVSTVKRIISGWYGCRH
jgi:hypothetical protein